MNPIRLQAKLLHFQSIDDLLSNFEAVLSST